jgi:hypothetical protein
MRKLNARNSVEFAMWASGTGRMGLSGKRWNWLV